MTKGSNPIEETSLLNRWFCIFCPWAVDALVFTIFFPSGNFAALVNYANALFLSNIFRFSSLRDQREVLLKVKPWFVVGTEIPGFLQATIRNWGDGCGLGCFSLEFNKHVELWSGSYCETWPTSTLKDASFNEMYLVQPSQSSTRNCLTSKALFGNNMHPWKLPWLPKNEGVEDEFPFQTGDFRFPC